MTSPNLIKGIPKTRIICLASPLIPLHWRGKGAFLEMPLSYNHFAKIVTDLDFGRLTMIQL